VSRASASDTIVAPATPAGRSAIAIVRIDGPLTTTLLERLGVNPLPAPRRVIHTYIHNNGVTLDDCVVVRYAAPDSFTGNDLVELSVHGNPLLVDLVVRAAVEGGARPAEPGEFTERAVLNGKMDLVQAESVADLIAARTSLQARLSLANLGGVLSRNANAIREILLHVMARLEAALDFADEGYEFIERAEASARLLEAREACARLADTFTRGRATTRGLSAVILGRPNAGKSTLLNRLVGSERAIVTEIPGTTRDIIRETLEIGGLPVELSDTAGLRASNDLVEGIGVARARSAAASADLVLYLIDSAEGETSEDTSELRLLAERGRSVVTLFTKTDLASPPAGQLGLSVAAERGIGELLHLLDEHVRTRFTLPEESPALINERQLAAVEQSAEALTLALDALARGLDEQVVLVDLYRAANALAALTGAITRDELFEEIFSRFCIGK
jgi:tRNA modification GTPase